MSAGPSPPEPHAGGADEQEAAGLRAPGLLSSAAKAAISGAYCSGPRAGADWASAGAAMRTARTIRRARRMAAPSFSRHPSGGVARPEPARGRPVRSARRDAPGGCPRRMPCPRPAARASPAGPRPRRTRAAADPLPAALSEGGGRPRHPEGRPRRRPPAHRDRGRARRRGRRRPRRPGHGGAHRRDHRPAGRLDLSHHLVAGRRAGRQGEQRRDPRGRLAGLRRAGSAPAGAEGLSRPGQAWQQSARPSAKLLNSGNIHSDSRLSLYACSQRPRFADAGVT